MFTKDNIKLIGIFLLMSSVCLLISMGCKKKKEEIRVVTPTPPPPPAEITIDLPPPPEPYIYKTPNYRIPWEPLITEKIEKKVTPATPTPRPVILIKKPKLPELKPQPKPQPPPPELFIDNLLLCAIIDDKYGGAALFKGIDGFGYVLKNNQLIGKNFTTLPGITGKVTKEKVELREKGITRVFRLGEEIERERLKKLEEEIKIKHPPEKSVLLGKIEKGKVKLTPAEEEVKKEEKIPPIRWHSSIGEDLLEKAKKEEKALLVYFYLPESKLCQKQDEVFKEEKIKYIISDVFIPIKINAQEERKMVKDYKITDFPTILVMNEKKEEIIRTMGYQDDKKLFASLLSGAFSMGIEKIEKVIEEKIKKEKTRKEE